jgi:hypothetical protein
MLWSQEKKCRQCYGHKRRSVDNAMVTRENKEKTNNDLQNTTQRAKD